MLKNGIPKSCMEKISDASQISYLFQYYFFGELLNAEGNQSVAEATKSLNLELEKEYSLEKTLPIGLALGDIFMYNLGNTYFHLQQYPWDNFSPLRKSTKIPCSGLSLATQSKTFARKIISSRAEPLFLG